MKRFLLPLLLALLSLCLVACVVTLPDPDEQITVQTKPDQTVVTGGATDAPATEAQTQAPETNTAPETTEEVTTYGELHFPEEGE